MANKSELVLFLILFYVILSVIIGFISNSVNSNLADVSSDFDSTSQNIDKGVFTFSDIITGYTSLPFWANLIIFGTFITLLTWIIVSSLPTINGGG